MLIYSIAAFLKERVLGCINIEVISLIVVHDRSWRQKIQQKSQTKLLLIDISKIIRIIGVIEKSAL